MVRFLMLPLRRGAVVDARSVSRVCLAPLLSTLLCVHGGAVCAAESVAGFPTNETLRQIRALEDPRLSPDGRHVLVRVVDSTADGARGHLYLVPVPAGSAQRLTVGPASDPRGEHDGVFTTDGRQVLFIAKRGDQSTLYCLPLDGGEALPVPLRVPVRVDDSAAADAITPLVVGTALAGDAALPADVVGVRVARTGQLAVLARDPQTPGEKGLLDGKADAVLVDHDRHRVRLYLLDGPLDTPSVRAVALPDGDVEEVAYSPDGQRLIALLDGAGHASDLAPSTSAWIVPTQGVGAAARLDALPPTVSRVGWSMDGHAVNFIAQAHADTPPGYSSVYRLDLSSGVVRAWPEGEVSVQGSPLADPDGGLLVRAQRGLEQPLVRYTVEAPDPEGWALPVASVEAFDANGAGVVFIGSSSGVPPALYVAARFGAPVIQLDAPQVLPPNTRTQAAERIEWTHEGRRLQGLLYLPTSDMTRRVPLVVDVHGGPLGAFSDRFDPFVDFLLGQGLAVLRTNPRGSTGRGTAFAAANRNDLGGGDYRDILSGLDWTLTRAPIDPTRLALFGYSYGGEMAGFVEGRTTRFKAIVSGAPVIDQFSEYGTEDGSWYDRWYFGKPWERAADAWRQSPLAGAANAHTPFLLLQGLADITDPPGQSQEMYRALRQRGVPVELVLYPREDHGGLARGMFGEPSPEPWHGFDARRRVVDFIQRHLTER